MRTRAQLKSVQNLRKVVRSVLTFEQAHQGLYTKNNGHGHAGNPNALKILSSAVRHGIISALCTPVRIPYTVLLAVRTFPTKVIKKHKRLMHLRERNYRCSMYQKGFGVVYMTSSSSRLTRSLTYRHTLRRDTNVEYPVSLSTSKNVHLRILKYTPEERGLEKIFIAVILDLH